MNPFKTGLFMVTAGTLTMAAGCTQHEYAPVSGTVTFEGKPVPNATVVFEPEVEGPTSVGTTASDGTFNLSIARERDKPGARIGSHRVTISAFEEPPPSNGNVDPELGSLVMATEPTRLPKNMLPEKYAHTSTSGLTFDVSASGDNVAKFELTK